MHPSPRIFPRATEAARIACALMALAATASCHAPFKMGTEPAQQTSFARVERAPIVSSNSAHGGGGAVGTGIKSTDSRERAESPAPRASAASPAPAAFPGPADDRSHLARRRRDARGGDERRTHAGRDQSCRAPPKSPGCPRAPTSIRPPRGSDGFPVKGQQGSYTLTVTTSNPAALPDTVPS